MSANLKFIKFVLCLRILLKYFIYSSLDFSSIKFYNVFRNNSFFEYMNEFFSKICDEYMHISMYTEK